MDQEKKEEKWVRDRHRLDLEEVRWRLDFEQDKTSRSRKDLDVDLTRLDWVMSCTA